MGRWWWIATLGFAALGLGVLGLIAMRATSVADFRLQEQRQQAAAALARWATAAEASAGGAIVVEPPAWDPYDPPVGLVPDSVDVSADERSLLVTFVGAPDPASVPCGVDYTGEAVESDLAVVVLIVEHRRPWPETCTSIGGFRTTTVHLAAPLADRAVLDGNQGLPIEINRPE